MNNNKNELIMTVGNLKLPLSVQAKTMIKNLNNFDEIDFMEWFISNISIGSNNILQYLIYKEDKDGS